MMGFARLNPSYACESTIRKSVLSDVIGGGCRFPAFAKPASAAERKSEKIMQSKR
jgi:hypothetical protein